MENIDAARNNGQNLLNILMESLPKMPDVPAETQETGAPASESATVKIDSQGDKINLLA
jgi:hypothetical protein